MSSSFSSSRFPATVRKAYKLLLTSRRALICLSSAKRAVDSETSGQKRNLASGESQYVSRKGCGDATDEALSWLLPIMATSSVIRSAASSSPFLDDAKTASSGDEVVSSFDDGAMELPPFNNLPCWLRRRVLFAAMLLMIVLGLL